MEKGEKRIIYIGLVVIFISLLIFIYHKNWEFVWYIISIFIIWTPLFIIFTENIKNKKEILLWLLVLIILHQIGGFVMIHETRLYDSVILPIFSGPYDELEILKFDQLVHIIGGGVIALIMFRAFENEKRLKTKFDYAYFYSLIIITSLGISTIHEMMEFISYFLGDTGVGFYFNTLLDYYSNLIGIVFTTTILTIKKMKHEK